MIRPGTYLATGIVGAIAGFAATMLLLGSPTASEPTPTPSALTADQLAVLSCEQDVLPHVVASISGSAGEGVDSAIMVLGGNTVEYAIHQRLDAEYRSRAFSEGVSNVMSEVIGDLRELCERAYAQSERVLPPQATAPRGNSPDAGLLEESPTACPHPGDPFPEGCELTASLSASVVRGIAEEIFAARGFDFDPDEPDVIQGCDFPDPAVPGSRLTCTYQLPDDQVIDPPWV